MAKRRWVITRAYGRCIEAIQRLDVRIRSLPLVERGGQDDSELKALLQEERDWAQLMRETPKFEETDNRA